MTAQAIPNLTFAYEAQTAEQRSLSGTIDAPHLDAAVQQLESIGLRIIRMETVEVPTIARTKPLNGQDFLAFNDQLAHLTSAGLPIEQGLRLIAQDIKHGRLAQTIRAVADELERGVPIAQAIAKYHDKFPPLYAQLIDAGSRSGDLGAMLLSIGRHIETVQKLRAALWRAIAYPLVVSIGLALVLLLLSVFVFPQFAAAYSDMGYGVAKHAHSLRSIVWGRKNAAPSAAEMNMPIITQILFAFGAIIPWLVGAFLALLMFAPVIWQLMRSTGADARFSDAILLRLPLVGKALKLNLLARWCDAVLIAARSGMDLPAAIRLAGETIRSPKLQHDSGTLLSALERGESFETTAGMMMLLPSVVPSMLELASRTADLPAALQTLTDLYQRQAEIRVRAIPTILTPLLMIVLALTIAFVVIGLLAPMLRIIHWLMGGAI